MSQYENVAVWLSAELLLTCTRNHHTSLVSCNTVIYRYHKQPLLTNRVSRGPPVELSLLFLAIHGPPVTR